MIRRRITAVALAAGCLLSQTGCTGFGNCAPTSSYCCGTGWFSRMWSPAPATCCTPACVPASPCSTCSSGSPVSPIMTSGFESGMVGAPVAGGGGPGCGCNRGSDPFQFTGMQGMGPGPITTIPGPISQGMPINVGPDMTAPMPSGPPYVPGPPPLGPPPTNGPRIVPVPQMQSPVPAGGYQPGAAYSAPWTPGH